MIGRVLVLAVLVLTLLAPGALAQGNLPAPAGLVVTTPGAPNGVTRLDLKWEKVPGAVGYEVLQWKNGKWWFNEDDPNRTPLTTSTSIGGLDPETAYEFCVRAVGSGGVTSALSASVGGRTQSRDISLSSNPMPTPPPQPKGDVEVISSKGKGSGLEPPEGLFAVFSSQDKVKLSWRPVRGATRYVIEEERDGKWGPGDNIVGAPASTSVEIINHPTPGPYKFRVRCVGPNGKLSEPSWVINIER